MPAPTITPLPTPPSRGDSPETFNAEADAFLGALPTLQTEVNAVVSWMDTTAAQVDADKTAAAASATAAAAAVGAVMQNITAFLGDEAGIPTGAWYVEYFVPVATTFTSFKGIVISGSGTFDLRVLVNDVDVYGPRTISTTVDSQTISLAVSANARVSLQVNNVTGTPILAEIQLLGLPT